MARDAGRPAVCGQPAHRGLSRLPHNSPMPARNSHRKKPFYTYLSPAVNSILHINTHKTFMWFYHIPNFPQMQLLVRLREDCILFCWELYQELLRVSESHIIDGNIACGI